MTFTERTSGFDADAAREAIHISAKDVAGADVADAYTVKEWVHIAGATADEDTHYVVITLDKDARYTVSVDSITDKAGNASKAYDPYSFVKDATAPTGTITVGDLGTWDDLSDELQ